MIGLASEERVCNVAYITAQQDAIMPESTTLTVRLPQESKQKLAELATRTRRTSSFLAAEAIAAYVTHELAAIEGIERGLAAAKAGRVIPHEEAMRRAREAIRSVPAKT